MAKISFLGFLFCGVAKKVRLSEIPWLNLASLSLSQFKLPGKISKTINKGCNYHAEFLFPISDHRFTFINE